MNRPKLDEVPMSEPSHRRLTLRVLLVVVAVAAVGLATVIVTFTGDRDGEVTRLLELLELEPGQTAAEIGAGTGWLTVEAAQRVGPSGHIFSTELSESRRAEIEQAVSNASLANVTVVAAGEHDTNLPDNCCDAIFMRRVYHHLSNVTAINESLYTALEPGGALAIIEFESDGWVGSLTGEGIAPGRLVSELTSAGFEHVETADWPGASHYVAVFERP